MSTKSDEVRDIVALAGGRIVGKTRLQKAVFILELAGVGFGFEFSYHHYGPYSEELAWATKDATAEGLVRQHEEQARWGGTYSVFSIPKLFDLPSDDVSKTRREILSRSMTVDAVVLELAATAALLKTEGSSDWWGETARLKPLKANPQTLAEAQGLWAKLRSVRTPRPLPALN
jgi:uncharacterized protein YwgA